MDNGKRVMSAIRDGHETMAALEEATGLDYDKLRAVRTYLVKSGQIEVYRTIKEKAGRGRKAGCYRLTGKRQTLSRPANFRRAEDDSINTEAMVRNAVARWCRNPGPFGGLLV